MFDRAKFFFIALGYVCAAMALGLILAVVLTKGAFSQPAPAAEQALSNMLMRQTQATFQCESNLIRMADELAQVRAELAALKKPTEPKK